MIQHPDGHIPFEYAIPRMGKRVDNILLMNGAVVVVEFKVGATAFDSAAIDQVVDHALDLKNYHEVSADLAIPPILVATEAKQRPWEWALGDDRVAEPVLVNANTLADAIASVHSHANGRVEVESWMASGYRPTSTIIERLRLATVAIP